VGNNARTFGQDLMRGEHTVGGGMNKQRLAPGGGGGGAWLGGSRTSSSKKFSTVQAGLIRGEMPNYDGATRDEASGTSIFDPVLCELAYRWFSPPGGVILDPFAGGSVRGIVASVLGREYHGVELRAVQVAANQAQAHIATGPEPTWYCADSKDIADVVPVRADMIFSCPPYADLEVYSDDPRDISTMPYGAFLSAYREIIAAACGKLKDHSFACFVVGEVRDKKGNYYNFVGDTVEAFKAAGLHFYNEAILVTAVGSLPIRVGKQFAASRKLGKTHQNVLVFVKGDGKKAARKCGGGE
jgi:hypothetical protein